MERAQDGVGGRASELNIHKTFFVLHTTNNILLLFTDAATTTLHTAQCASVVAARSVLPKETICDHPQEKGGLDNILPFEKIVFEICAVSMCNFVIERHRIPYSLYYKWIPSMGAYNAA